MIKKRSISILLDSEVFSALEKRAKRELMTIRELVSDILRRSVISSKRRGGYRKIKAGDKFIEYFSRHPSGRKRKKRKKKSKK